MREVYSALQRAILLAALRGRARARTGSKAAHQPGADATFAEIQAKVRGWEPQSTPAGASEGDRRPRFSRAAIGPDRHDAAKVSLSKSVTRLEERGLVTRVARAVGRGAGVILTDAGLDAAF